MRCKVIFLLAHALSLRMSSCASAMFVRAPGDHHAGGASATAQTQASQARSPHMLARRSSCWFGMHHRTRTNVSLAHRAQIFMLVEQTPRQEWFAGMVVHTKPTDKERAAAKEKEAKPIGEPQWNKLVGKWQARPTVLLV